MLKIPLLNKHLPLLSPFLQYPTHFNASKLNKHLGVGGGGGGGGGIRENTVNEHFVETTRLF